MILSILVPPAILLLEYKTKAEMSHIPQSQDAHQMTMEDSEHNFHNTTDNIQMVRINMTEFISSVILVYVVFSYLTVCSGKYTGATGILMILGFSYEG